MAGPETPPPAGPDPRRKRRVSGSMAMPITVLTSVTASAPAAWAAPATSTRLGALGLSLAQRGRPHASVAAMTSAVAEGEWAKRSRPASVLGHDRLTSTATTPAAASASNSAARRYSSTLRPQIDATTRAPVASSGPTSSSSHAFTPGPCSPTELIIPAVVSWTRSGGLPGHGSACSDLTTTAPRAPRSR
jgi:hypothetical protein